MIFIKLMHHHFFYMCYMIFRGLGQFCNQGWSYIYIAKMSILDCNFKIASHPSILTLYKKHLVPSLPPNVKDRDYFVVNLKI